MRRTGSDEIDTAADTAERLWSRAEELVEESFPT